MKKDTKRYRVYWRDITSFINKKIDKPYCQFLTNCWTEGQIKKDKDTILVIYSDGGDNEFCGDAIPLSCVIKIEEIK